MIRKIFLENNLFKIGIFTVCLLISIALGYCGVDNLFTDILFYIGGGGLTVVVCMFFVFAWIINPISSLLKKNK